jgi:hypothetical protein
MDTVKIFRARFRLAHLLLLLAYLSVTTAAQTQQQAGRPAAQQQQDQSPKQPDENLGPTQENKQPDPGAAKTSQQKPEVKITPREAEELFHSVDEILAFDSKHTGLPIKKEVKRRLTSRDEVVSYLTKHMKDEDVKRLQRSELVLKKFGLLPRDFDLEKLLVSLLREQVTTIPKRRQSTFWIGFRSNSKNL